MDFKRYIQKVIEFYITRIRSYITLEFYGQKQHKVSNKRKGDLRHLVKIQIQDRNQTRSDQIPDGKGERETVPGQGTTSCHEQNKEKIHINNEKSASQKPMT